MKTSIVLKLTTSIEELDQVIRKTRSRLKNAPVGSLNIRVNKGLPEYYWNTVEAGKRKKYYLGKKDIFRIESLAQKEFDLKIIRIAEQQRKCIEKFLKQYEEDALRNAYKNLSPERKKLVNEDILDDEEYARRWQALEYETGRFDSEVKAYYTQKGEKVRSKSEKIIADTLYAKGIPYRYEYPLYLNSGQTWRPDFTILNVRTREEYILEHFGMMDDPGYLANALGKIRIYMENGYFPGEKLLITAESSASPLSTKVVDMLIQNHLM